MESTEARRVFPCFDEPAMKAKFDVTIIHRRETTALGNWEEAESTIIDDEWKFTHFHTTREMSTYLLAFSVSEFISVPSAHERVTIQTYARPEAIKAGQADYAASITGKILQFYENYLGINFPQKKLDQIAVPDFGPAAMENWGLVVYQEASLLFEEGVSSMLDKEGIGVIIAHELAHQWFGNLVTMKWWNAAWLKEGFAVYLSYLALDHIAPEFNIRDVYVAEDLHSSFEVDALAVSRPLTAPAKDVQMPHQILEMFDVITYSKGAAVLMMLADLVTDRVFQTGIKMYLHAFEYGNTEPKDLWQYMQKAVDEDGGHIQVAKVMEKWTNQSGFPVITINTTTGEAYQRHFLFNQTSESDLVWHVPVKVKSQNSGPSLVWLDTSSTVKKEEFLSKDGEWILANLNTGYYIVNYNPENWDCLLTQLENDASPIPIINRGQLINDVFYLARAKIVDVTLALNATRFLRNETEYLPWESVVTNLNFYFVSMFDRTEVYGPMQAYLRQQVKGLYDFYRNYTDTSTVPSNHSSQRNQINAVMLACINELPECRIMATKMFATWMKNETENKIHPNLRSTIYCQAIADGGEKEWEFAWNRFQNTSDVLEKNHLRFALACTTKIWLLNRYLQYTLDPEKIHKAQVESTICSIARNVAGQALAWDFIRAHWADLSKGYFDMVIQCVTQRFSTDFELEEVIY
ncbi:hypothetical protein LDENG_00210690 [Lucifuga dentata]|nr:hypothetical protein LDENG_00210690 [Lucifuga dentata]